MARKLISIRIDESTLKELELSFGRMNRSRLIEGFVKNGIKRRKKNIGAINWLAVVIFAVSVMSFMSFVV